MTRACQEPERPQRQVAPSRRRSLKTLLPRRRSHLLSNSLDPLFIKREWLFHFGSVFFPHILAKHNRKIKFQNTEMLN